MDNLVTHEHFVGELLLPLTNTDVDQEIQLLIRQRQEELLLDLFGYALYKEFAPAVSVPQGEEIAQRWIDLRDGVEYTAANGSLRRWMGLREVTTGAVYTTKRRSIIANYVYWYWMQNNISRTTTNGEMAQMSESSRQVSPAAKMTRAWNQMSAWIDQLFDYLTCQAATYPEWDIDVYAVQRKYRAINRLGI